MLDGPERFPSDAAYPRNPVTGSAASTQPSSDEPLGREVWIVAGVVIVGVVMSTLDTTTVNVALETLSRS